MNITQFVNDKDDRARGYQGQTSLEVRFEYYAEHPSDDENQESSGFADLFAAVDEARALAKRSGRPTQVRIALPIDEEGRYIEAYCEAK